MKLTDFMVKHMDIANIKVAEIYINRGIVSINSATIKDTNHYMENTSRIKISDNKRLINNEAWFCVAKENK